MTASDAEEPPAEELIVSVHEPEPPLFAYKYIEPVVVKFTLFVANCGARTVELGRVACPVNGHDVPLTVNVGLVALD